VLDWIDLDKLTVSPGEAATVLLDELLDEGHDDLRRLGLLARVAFPRLVASWSRHLAAASAPGDGPVMRALRLVRRDEVDGWMRGELLLQRLLGAEAAAVVAEGCALLEARLAAVVPGGGLIAWPRPAHAVGSEDR